MNLQDFKASLSQPSPPAGLSIPLLSLWQDGKGDWDTAHTTADSISTADAAWVHAYLHRKEGDTWNADYWYRRAGRVRPRVSLEEEWEAIVGELLGKE